MLYEEKLGLAHMTGNPKIQQVRPNILLTVIGTGLQRVNSINTSGKTENFIGQLVDPSSYLRMWGTVPRYVSSHASLTGSWPALKSAEEPSADAVECLELSQTSAGTDEVCYGKARIAVIDTC